MELKQLQHFVRVAELGSFSRAALVLGVAQPVLSRHVRALEVELHQSLFHRHGRGVVLSESGEILLGHARAVLLEVDLARERLGGSGRLAGHVSVGMPPGLARALALRVTHEFKRRLPAASLSISEGSTATMQEWVSSGRVDLALVYQAGPLASLETMPLREERLYLVGARREGNGPGEADAILLKDASVLPLVMPSRPSIMRSIVEGQMASLGLKPSIVHEIEAAASILDVVRDGGGFAILPRSSIHAAGHAEDFCVRLLCEPELTCQLSLARSARRAATPTQAAAREILAEVIALAEG